MYYDSAGSVVSSSVVGKQGMQKALSVTCVVSARKYTIVPMSTIFNIIQIAEVEYSYE